MSEIDGIGAEIIIFPGPQPAEPVSWLMMPEHLTSEMVEAAGEAIEEYHRNGERGFVEMVEAMYEAMKAAAPKRKPAACDLRQHRPPVP